MRIGGRIIEKDLGTGAFSVTEMEYLDSLADTPWGRKIRAMAADGTIPATPGSLQHIHISHDLWCVTRTAPFDHDQCNCDPTVTYEGAV